MKIPFRKDIAEVKESDRLIEGMFSTAMSVFIISYLISVIGPTIDGIFVGSYFSVDDVAAIGLASFLLVGYRTLAASIISAGANILVSRLIGSGDKEEANSVFSLSLVLALGASCLIALLSIIFSDQIAVFLGAKGDLANLMKPTSDYLVGYSLGLPFYTVTIILIPFLKMDGDYSLVTVSSIVMTIVDILADLYVIKCTDGGLFMIGLATTVGHVASCLIVLSHFLFRDSLFHFSLRKIRWGQSLEVLRIGSNTGVIKLSTTMCGIMINRMLAAFVASEVIAAFGVGNQVLKFCFAFWTGAASTLMSFSSMFVGEEDPEALKTVQRTALRQSLTITCIAAAIIFVFSVPIAGLFLKSGDASVIAMASDSIRFFALSMPLNVAIYCFQFYLMGVGRYSFANLYSVIVELIMPVLVTILMLLAIGYRAAWVAKPVVGLLCLAIAILYIWRQPGSAFREKMLMLPKNFSTAPGQEMIFKAYSSSDVPGISRIAIAFALENGIKKRDAYTISLAIEELVNNIMEHGFRDGKPHVVHIRMLIKNDEFILRLRDNCRRFDQVDKYRKEIQYDEDPERRIGIRMIMGLVKNVKYTGLFGMNNLIIRIPKSSL